MHSAESEATAPTPTHRAPDAGPAPPASGPERTLPPEIARWVKTECGRGKYLGLAHRRGFWARLRRWWFVLMAALRDWRLPPPEDATSASPPS